MSSSKPGGGKTTLLNTLAGRQIVSGGEITLNGAALNKTLKRKISYVLQEDVFFSNLTLQETLSFTTMLRLPDGMSKRDKMNRMEEVIDALDIRKCLGTIFGDAWSRGLSGGEKKRASVACEMITDPNMIFLDEPTSGLDYSTSLSLVSTLKKVAMQFNKTVIMTIHQPSSKIFFLFDKLLLMCDGQVAYYGKCRDVIDFYGSLDMLIDPFVNPADFIVDKLKEGEDVKLKILKGAQSLRTSESWPKALRASNYTSTTNEAETAKGDRGLPSGNSSGFLDKLKKSLPSKSSLKQTKEEEEDGRDPGSVHVSLMDLEKEDLFDDAPKWPTGFVTQLLRVLFCVYIHILVSLIWFQLPRTEETLRDRVGALFFISIHWGFTPLFDAVSSCGFYTRNLPVWLNWIKYISFLHYSFHSVLLLEFQGADPVRCAENVNTSSFPSCMSPNSTLHIDTEQVLDHFDIKWTFAEYFLPLLLFIFLLRIGGYLLLRFLHRPVSV